MFFFLVDSMMFRNSKNFMVENAIEGLDELARVTVSNDNETNEDVNIFVFLRYKKNVFFFYLDNCK